MKFNRFVRVAFKLLSLFIITYLVLSTLLTVTICGQEFINKTYTNEYVSNVDMQNRAIFDITQLHRTEIFDEPEPEVVEVMIEEPIIDEEPMVLDSGFRSYMPWTALDPNSLQGKILHKASPNEHGFMAIDGIPCVAIGTGWGWWLGDILRVYTTNGSYDVIYGDMKSDYHTDVTNKISVSNGCVVEFIVDMNALREDVKYAGSVAILDEYSGYVLDIVKIGEIEID